MRAITTLQSAMNLALLILATWASAIKSPLSNEGSHAACDSLECASLAAQIASYMNSMVDPCMDFYNYSCGNIKNAVKHDSLNSATDLFYDESYLGQAQRSDFTNEWLSRGVHKMLAFDSTPTSDDAGVTKLYEFTRNFYKSCTMWVGSREINTESVRNLNGLYRHMVRTLKKAFNKDYAIESILAALVMTGDNNGYLSVSPFSEFMDSALEHKDNNLTKTARAVVQLIIPYNNSIFTWQRHEKLIEYFNSIVDSEFSFGDTKATFHSLFSAQSNWTMYNMGISCLDKYDNKYDFALSQLDSISACVQPKNPFSWTNFFGALLEAKLDDEAIFKVPDLVKVIGYASYMKTRHTARNKPVSEEVALLIFDWLLGFSQFFPKYLMDVPLVQRRTRADIHLRGIGEGSTFCQDLTIKMLSPIAGRMFQKAYHREDISDIRHLIKKIKSATINKMRSQTWISPNSKAAITHKIEQISENIGILNPRELKTFYKTLLDDYRIASKDTKQGNIESNFGSLLAIARLSNRRRTWELMSGMKNISPYEYIKIAHSGLSSLMLNAFDAQRHNQLLLPVASDDPVLYHHAYPEYIKLGTLAYAISHEIRFLFDLRDHEVQHNGKVGQFWDTKTDANFRERVNCVRKHYGSYALYPGGPFNNDVATANGYIADLIGTSAATAALETLKRQGEPMPMLPNLSKSFTADQLFFIQMAQRYCVSVKNRPKSGNFQVSPGFIRVPGMARNSKAFAKAFNCPSGSPMNPTYKCIFW